MLKALEGKEETVKQILPDYAFVAEVRVLPVSGRVFSSTSHRPKTCMFLHSCILPHHGGNL